VVVAALPASTHAGGSPFRIVDLGAPVGGGYSQAIAINNEEQVAGNFLAPFDSGDYESHAFSWTEQVGMIDLGTLGGPWSRASALSGTGEVVGSSRTPEPNFHPFAWTQQGGMVDLGTLAEGRYASAGATAVNDNGLVVGLGVLGDDPSNDPWHAFAWTQDGGMLDLGTLGGTSSEATAVNNNGVVVGRSGIAGDHELHPFAWTKEGGMVDLGTLGGTYASPIAINDVGQVVGDSLTANNAQNHAFIWTQSAGMVDLGTLGGSYSSAVAVNKQGMVVGASSTAGDAETHAFAWTQEGGMVDLGTIGGISSQATAVNGTGQVVGNSSSANPDDVHAFSWTEQSGMVDLGPAKPNVDTGGITSEAESVNDSGQVVGWAFFDSAENHATLWEPVPLSDLFHGFFQPVNNNGVFNVVKAGSGIAVKFDLSGDQGLAVFADGYPRSVPIDESGTADEDLIEETVSAGNSGLHYDATVNPPVGQYIYVWKTDKSWAGTSRQLQVKLSDGHVFTANFRFTG
jgi:probable HAF family extracellular repeat protein